MPDIGRDIAAAIDGHLRALRLLKREETTVADVATALGLPDSIVERAFEQFRMTGAKLAGRRKAKVSPLSPVIELRQTAHKRDKL